MEIAEGSIRVAADRVAKNNSLAMRDGAKSEPGYFN